jgi:hypothetical protein
MNATKGSGVRFAAMLALVLAGASVTGCESTGPRAAAEYRADQPEARNMRLVGYNDLQARSAYQPVIHQQGSRWILYIGHHGGARLNPLTGTQELNGTSILDVTVHILELTGAAREAAKF